MATSGPKSTGGGTWGSITGTLSNQTDLISFLSATYFPITSFGPSFNSAFAAKSTSDLSEGSNLYYTAGRFNSAFATKSTTDLAEGSNLYYTNERVDARIALSVPLDLVSYTFAGGF